MGIKFDKILGKLREDDTPTSYYTEPVYLSTNSDVVYVAGTNPVPDYIYDNNGDMVFELNII